MSAERRVSADGGIGAGRAPDECRRRGKPFSASGLVGTSAGPIRAIALVGPTASGKSALALAAAARWPLEIISVDSAQVYRGMDIGTAKPSPAERAAVPHHLIEIGRAHV